MLIRPRSDDDVDALLAIANVVREHDGYPAWLGGSLRGFLVSDDALAAWAAELDGRVVGQVALHRHSSREVLDAACAATGRMIDELAVVARLLVARDARRHGVAFALLDAAVAHAHAVGRRPVLDVVASFAPAVALYDAAGWERVDTVTVVIEGFEPFVEHVYIGPDVPPT